MTADTFVRVAEAYHRDVGRGIAKIDPDLMQRQGLVSGDVIEIIGKEKSYARVMPGYLDDVGKNIIRIDGNIRNNLRVGIDDKVAIKR